MYKRGIKLSSIFLLFSLQVVVVPYEVVKEIFAQFMLHHDSLLMLKENPRKKTDTDMDLISLVKI